MSGVSAAAAVFLAVVTWSQLGNEDPRFEYEMSNSELTILQIGGTVKEGERVGLELVVCSGMKVSVEPIGSVWTVFDHFDGHSGRTYFTQNMGVLIKEKCARERGSLVFIHNSRTIKVRWPRGVGTITEPVPIVG